MPTRLTMAVVVGTVIAASSLMVPGPIVAQELNEAEAVTAFLFSGAGVVGQEVSESAAEPLSAALVMRASSWRVFSEPEELYAQQCAACHGSEGRGDGPAAVVFNPRPTDFTDAEFWAERTDPQIDSVIVAGKGAMPPLGNATTPEARQALIEYLREKFTADLSSDRLSVPPPLLRPTR